MQMKTASAISTGLHVAVLLWATLSYSGKAINAAPAQSLPVDLISDKEFSEITKGIKEAPKPAEKPKPLVEKVADTPKAVEDIKPKVSEKKEIKAAAEKQPEPAPKPDPIAKEIKKAETQEAKVAPQRLPPRRPRIPRKPKPKFSADKIAALLDKRAPTRAAATGATLSAPTLGTALGNAARLSQSELDALRARLMSLWNPPVGIQNPEEYIIRIRIQLDRNGRLTAPPQVITSGKGKLFQSARDSAVRAVFRGQPFDMLKPEHYATWKDIEVTFDPRDMFRG
jgi:outer membrane biosynthesis protein TonB